MTPARAKFRPHSSYSADKIIAVSTATVACVLLVYFDSTSGSFNEL